ncbi:MAG: polysaccharide biosynthesis protein [Lachnospiraceae bacterium]
MKKFLITKINDSIWMRRFFLFIFDIISIAIASYSALLVRFDFSFDLIPENYEKIVVQMLPFTIITTIVVFIVFRLYSSLWTYAGATELTYILGAGVTSGFVNMFLIITCCRKVLVPLPRSYYVLYTIVLIGCVFISRYAYRMIRSLLQKRVTDAEKKKVLIVGAGSAGDALIREINHSDYINMKVVGVIDDSNSKIGNYIHGVKVLGDRNAILDNVKALNVDEIIVAMPSVATSEIKDILDICKESGCELKRLPGMYQLVNGEVSVSKLRDVDVNDLLGREPIQVDLDSIMDYVSDRVIMVTGGGGSIGSELCRQIAKHNPKQLVLVDIYENTTYDIQNELKKNFPELNLVVLIASVRNTKRMDQIFEIYRPEIVYHAAAHKHVPLMEDSPNEAVKNNVLGTWKVVQAADKWHVKRFVMISTDKAVNPTNIMGATKRICEMIIQAYDKHSETEFVAVRFGNVLGSNGSVIPLFKKQIEAGGPVTVTHPDIIRYFMTIPEAVSLVLQAGAYAKGGEIFVLDMGEPVKILDLARNLILLSGHKPNEDIMITFTGLRPGEKLYEEMLMKEEGMQNTANKLIYIGKPIEMDEEKFMRQLEEIRDYVVEEPDDIREVVQKMVPTYHFKR